MSIIVEPAKVLFLNNAINHGVFTPLGIEQAAETGKSILFLIEANPGPGLGLLLAFTFFGVGAAKASAPGAAIIQFFGGIHEIYFPYALSKPMTILALIAGGATGVTTNMLLGGGLAFPAAPGSIIAVTAAAIGPGVGNLAGRLPVGRSSPPRSPSWSPASSCGPRASATSLAEGDTFGAAIAQTEANKGKTSAAMDALRASDGDAASATPTRLDGSRPAETAVDDGGRDHADQEHRVRLRRRHGLVGDGRERAAQQDQEGGHRGRHGRQQGDREPRRHRPTWSSRRTS